MSGIAGIFYLNDRPVVTEQLERMRQALAHRGPDGYRLWKSCQVGLLHCRLNTTPESIKEQLPEEDMQSGLVITADARLDNRQELLAVFSPSLHQAGSVPDSKLILAAYQKWGADCAAHLLGDFAFVIWDKAQNRLFCARDHMGVKPFYYYRSDSFVSFSTEIKGLLCNHEVKQDLNEDRIADFIAVMALDNSSTFFKQILRLPPGHSLIVHPGRISQPISYWQPRPAQLPVLNRDEYAEAFREIFTESVRCRLRSAFPVGTFLSGGLDSSSITCMAAGPLKQCLSGPLHSFSGVFDTMTSCDERHYFQPVLDRYQITPHFLLADQLDGPQAFDKMVEWEDEPFFAPHFFMGLNLLQLMQGLGVRTLLDGHDGDSAVSYGYTLLPELARKGKWLQWFTEMRALNSSSRKALAKYPVRIMKDVLYRKIPQWLFTPQYQKDFLKTVEELNPDLVKKTDIKGRLLRHILQLPNYQQDEQTFHLLNIIQPIHSTALEFMNKTAARFHVEQRLPFFDKRLIEFCLALPADQKLYQGLNRHVCRHALRDILPESIRQRKSKTDFSPNLVNTFSEQTSNWLALSFASLPDCTFNYIDKSKLVMAYNRFNDPKNTMRQVELFFILRALSLGKWLHKMDGGREHETG
ncbi:MAG: lasso peptide isopeptide bond-forming cyclase [Proteobacteria bacterium]|nr:lasso peptide isopeptide bond-forming cyclase [Desulfocapsa sp.]MBU3945574.1 lasso peptide isopeptide bond-forming cyclase [Pseudomonadota bacterium]MCG2745136.1 lasso peptide isopeptide bond-forming cyclase [Desulfobacteraceae bacterium]MBU4029781.1 lasso peptide isopeptide bond-forming cyclase [Pseudomonadota bacterium]MBU4041604.1 lasso peptide isopeptide bond-forming cyclase [Pseudomonadota bacterium]